MGRERSGLRNIDKCTTHSGPFSHGYARRTPNHQESYFNNTRYQPSSWQEKANKAWPNIVFLRTVTTYRVAKFCVDSKIKHNFHIHIHIHIFIFIRCQFVLFFNSINNLFFLPLPLKYMIFFIFLFLRLIIYWSFFLSYRQCYPLFLKRFIMYYNNRCVFLFLIPFCR